MPATKPETQSISLAIIGSGGAGALTAGAIILEAAAKSGWYGIMNRSVGPQIRGGEAAALVRLASHRVDCMGREYDLLIAIDWKNAERFASEMPLARGGIIVNDPAAGDVPDEIGGAQSNITNVAMKDLAKQIPGGRENMIAVGIATAIIGLSIDVIMQIVAAKLSEKGNDVVEVSRECIVTGMAQVSRFTNHLKLPPPQQTDAGRWLITGNEAVGYGAVRGGIRFAAAYPITPATEVLEWMAPALAKVGGALVQAEDELSSINMAIGASFGGRASITATSGPGLALMIEALGLATASEVPIVVVDVMRGGPSTGIPTKSEQSDLNIAIYGCHGDAPHIVTAPLSVGDCIFTAQWTVYLAEALQTAAILLSDQSIGQARVIIDRPANISFVANRKIYQANAEQTAEQTAEQSYERYALTADGISPMAIPGTAGGQYTADGLTHNVRGVPSSTESDHRNQHDKRHNKIADFNYGNHWAEIETPDTDASDADAGSDFTILVWGSLTGPAREAIATLAQEGIRVKLVAMRLLAPFLKQPFLAALKGCDRTLIVEQSHSGQFHKYLRSQCDLPGQIRHLHRPGPHLIGAGEICEQIRDWKNP